MTSLRTSPALQLLDCALINSVAPSADRFLSPRFIRARIARSSFSHTKACVGFGLSLQPERWQRHCSVTVIFQELLTPRANPLTIYDPLTSSPYPVVPRTVYP